MKNNALIIFGGTGDLAYRKLFPALYDLYIFDKLEKNFYIIGIGRRDYTNEDYRSIIKDWVKNFSRGAYNEEKFEKFCLNIFYYKLHFMELEEYKNLYNYFNKMNLSNNLIYYYAVSPEFFEPITDGLAKHSDILKESKIIVEKPFGKDLESAQRLNLIFKKYLDYKNIYYIDHYLGKEMLLNIMTIRFFNTMFNGVWNNEFIDNVQINVFESIGVETRGGYYDKSGAIADMLQNHIFQILSIVAMNEPDTFSSSDIKDAQIDIFKKLRKINSKDIDDYMVLGQYDGYIKEKNVNPNSKTETYVAMKIFIDNERWKDVPFYVRTGKKLHSREMSIIIQFKPTTHTSKMLAQNYGNGDLQQIAENNILEIKIQPEEGINLRFNIKKPGTSDDIDVANLNYCQSCDAQNSINSPWSYERLLEACMNSNRTLFSRWEQIELSWKYMNEVMDNYRKYSNKLYIYEKGSKGPAQAEKIIGKDGRKWI